MNKDIHALLIEFQIYWNETLNGNYKNSPQLKSLAIQIKELSNNPIVRASINPTEQTILSNAIIIANIK